MGVADPDRMGVGGWSYGGILTDYMIATDSRFKGATSGAGTAFTVTLPRQVGSAPMEPRPEAAVIES